MATTTALPRDVKSSFNYYNSQEPPPIAEIQSVFAGKSNRTVSVPTTVRDLRQHDTATYNIDRNGFQIVQHSSSLLPPQSAAIPDFHDEDLMHSQYWPELSQLLKDSLGVRAAVAINTTVRDVSTDNAAELKPDNPRANPKISFHPFFIVHCDYTPPGARGHMRAMLPSFFEDNGCGASVPSAEQEEFFALRNEIIRAEDEAMREEGVDDVWAWSGRNYKGPRWAMLSVWRPLETVHRDPLGVLMGSARNGDVVEGTCSRAIPYVRFPRNYKKRPGFVDEYKSENSLSLGPKMDQGERHAWGYLSEQRNHEVLLLKLFDSEADKEGSGFANSTSHSAFSLPEQDGQPLRRSAEVRCMVVW